MNKEQILLSIIAHARAGALDYAWRMLRESGFDGGNDDPAVLSIIARLQKDRGLRARGDVRRRLYLESAEIYARAARLSRTTYPLINAATLSLLAGNRNLAQTLAHEILDKGLQADEQETPYWRLATRAEALLLLGDIEQAKSALAEAMAISPRAYEDHASTLRQFGMILEELREDQSWLDPLRPPKCLHFAGHMQVDAGDPRTREAVRNMLLKERVGFGFGALGAGADIGLAETLLDLGAELHVILPMSLGVFRDVSVRPFGDIWLSRFERLLQEAETVRTVGEDVKAAEPFALQVASEVAMGSAVMRAKTLMTQAVQLLILDGTDARQQRPGSGDWASLYWKATGRGQHIITAPRAPVVTVAQREPDPHSQSSVLAAMLRIGWSEKDIPLVAGEFLPQIHDLIASRQNTVVSSRLTDDMLTIAFTKPADAIEIALSIADLSAAKVDIRIAGHYGVFDSILDPFGGSLLFLGKDAAIARSTMASTPPGAIYATEILATALHAGSGTSCPRTDFVGELPKGDGRLHLYSVSR